MISNVEYRILDFIDRNGPASFGDIADRMGDAAGVRDFVIGLSAEKLIVRSATDSSRYGLSALGTVQLQRMREIRGDALADRKRDRRRYIITTTIAALALILAIASLAWQAYTWRSERSQLTGSQNTMAATTGTLYPPSDHLTY